jgi:xanthine dehydrogenase accessory factor
VNGPVDVVQTAADRLRAEGRRFVAATVVRAERPTSARAGDRAVVLDDGTIVGFVGGECARASVQFHALAALAAGEPRLLRITPEGAGPRPPSPGGPAGDVNAGVGVEAGADASVVAEPDASGAVTVHNPCLSGGALEIFLEPSVPPGIVVVHGDSVIAQAVAELAGWLGYAVEPALDPAGTAGDVAAVVVASHGGDEGAVLEAALRAGVPYVGLVASPRRGAGVLEVIDLPADDLARISTPAGLDIGSRTPQEVALSILAELVAVRRGRPAVPVAVPDQVVDLTVPAAAAVGSAVDPVCGMTVATVDSARHVDHDGVRYWFCGAGCEEAFLSDPAAFVT